jgi:Xaa-Pro aminopeptidase
VPGAELLECRNLLRLVRMVKGAPEIGVLRRAAAVNERAAVAATAALHDGNSTGSLSQRFRVAVAEAGALFDHCTPTIAGMSFVAADAHVFADQETFALDVGCSVEGYYADAQFTVALTPSAAAAVAGPFDVIRHCVLDVGLALARAGTRASVIHHAMADFLSQEGVAAFPTGHGLGLEFRDYPILVADSGLRIHDECVDREADVALEVDMVLNVEATALLAGAAVGCEVTCVVTDGDPLLLSPEDRAIRICRGVQGQRSA